jgi:hypothetical protein
MHVRCDEPRCTCHALGGVHDAGGMKGSCGSQLRGAGFPWKCTGDVVVNDLDAVDAFLGIPKGPLAHTRA